MWDQDRNLWTNNFYDALEIVPNAKTPILDDKINEDSTHEDSTHEEFQCKSGLEKVLRASSLTPVCVTPYSASVLIDYGWTIPAQ